MKILNKNLIFSFQMGLEPTTPSLEGWCAIHCATGTDASCGIRTHEGIRPAELKSAALDQLGQRCCFVFWYVV